MYNVLSTWSFNHLTSFFNLQYRTFTMLEKHFDAVEVDILKQNAKS